MRSKYLGRFALVAALGASLLSAACSKASETHEAKLGAQGGTIKLGDVTVTAPPGAVTADTQISATTPEADEKGPFAGKSQVVRFDLSLAGNTQPAKPLTLSIPLKGDFLPKGASAQQALLYTPGPNGSGFRLVPTTVDAAGTLHATVSHLSPKYVAFVDSSFLGLPFANGAPKETPSCKEEVVAGSTGKVRITTRTGWSTAADSPISACLGADGDTPTMAVRNRLNYMLQVATTKNVTISAPAGDAEDEIVKLLTRSMFPNSKVKALLGREQELTVKMPTSSLPATVELQADPSTYLAETTWFATTFLVGILLGEKSDKVAQRVKLVLDAPQVLSCLKSAVTMSSNLPSAGEVLKMITSKCTEIIAGQLKGFASSPEDWNKMWGRFFAIGGGVVGGWNNFWTAIDGIKMQLNNTIRIGVGFVGCPTKDEFKEAVRRGRPGVTPGYTNMDLDEEILCQDGWAITNADLNKGQRDANRFVPLLHWQNGRWNWVSGGSEHYGDPNCFQMTPEARRKILGFTVCQ